MKAIERVNQHNNSNFNFINNNKKNADLIKKITAIKNINAIDSDLLNSYDYIRGFLIGHKDAFQRQHIQNIVFHLILQHFGRYL